MCYLLHIINEYKFNVMCNMPIEGIKIEKHFRKILGQYFTDGFGSDGSVVKGLRILTI